MPLRLISILLIVVCYCFTACAQEASIPKKKNQHNWQWLDKHHKSSYDDCTFTNRYTLWQRLKRYPFNKAVKILAVSYHVAHIPKTNDDTLQTTGLKIRSDELDYSTLIEVKELSTKQIASLTNLIFNTDYKVKMGINSIEEGSCFNPRNALIFYDKNGKIFDYIEICFQCLNAYSKNDKFTIGTPCTQKYDLLKKWFISAGIKYGTLHIDKGD